MTRHSISIRSKPHRLRLTGLTAVALFVAMACSTSQASTNVTGSGDTGIVNAGGTLQTPIGLAYSDLAQGGVEVSGAGSTVGLLGTGNQTASAAVDGMAEASYGLLRARASGSLETFTPRFTDIPFLKGEFSASFDDVLVVSSNTLAIGTPVMLQMTMSFDSVITSNTVALLFLDFQLANGAGQVVDLRRGSPSYLSIPQQTYGFTYPVSFADTVGDTLHLSALLEVGVDQFFNGESFQSGPFEGDYIYNHPSVDASHTSKVFLDALTPDVSLVAASGHDYSSTPAAPVSAVPEPGTLPLVLAGFATMICWGRMTRLRTSGAHRQGDHSVAPNVGGSRCSSSVISIPARAEDGTRSPASPRAQTSLPARQESVPVAAAEFASS